MSEGVSDCILRVIEVPSRAAARESSSPPNMEVHESNESPSGEPGFAISSLAGAGHADELQSRTLP